MAPPWASKSRPIQSNYPAFQQQADPDSRQTMSPDIVFDPRGPTTNIQRKLSIPSEVVVQAGIRSAQPSTGYQSQQAYQPQHPQQPYQQQFPQSNQQQFQQPYQQQFQQPSQQQFQQPSQQKFQQANQQQPFQQPAGYNPYQQEAPGQFFTQEFANQNFQPLDNMHRPSPAVPAKGNQPQQSAVTPKGNQQGQFANGGEPFRPPQQQGGQRPGQPAGKQLFKQAPDNRGATQAVQQHPTGNFQQPSDNFQFLKIAGATPYQQPQAPQAQKPRRWTIDKLRATDAIIPLQSGTNQYSSQRGMTGFGTPRDVNGKHVHRLWEEEYPEYITNYYGQN